MKKIDLEPGTYWIHSDEYRHNKNYITAYLNKDSQWKIQVNETTKFISNYAMELVFGRGFVVRKVDFVKDKKITEFEDMNLFNSKLFPYALGGESEKDYVVIMKNNNIVDIVNVYVPSHSVEDGFYLEFSEEV